VRHPFPIGLFARANAATTSRVDHSTWTAARTPTPDFAQLPEMRRALSRAHGWRGATRRRCRTGPIADRRRAAENKLTVAANPSGRRQAGDGPGDRGVDVDRASEDRRTHASARRRPTPSAKRKARDVWRKAPNREILAAAWSPRAASLPVFSSSFDDAGRAGRDDITGRATPATPSVLPRHPSRGNLSQIVAQKKDEPIWSGLSALRKESAHGSRAPCQRNLRGARARARA